MAKGKGEVFKSREPVKFNEKGGFTIYVKNLPEDVVSIANGSFTDVRGEEVQVVSIIRLGGYVTQYFSNGEMHEFRKDPDGNIHTINRVMFRDEGRGPQLFGPNAFGRILNSLKSNEPE